MQEVHHRVLLEEQPLQILVTKGCPARMCARAEEQC